MKTVLLVDDEPLIRSLHEEMVISLGYAVITAGDAESALSRVITGDAVDLVITDYQMPGTDGIEFIRALRRVMPSLPVLMVSGVDDPVIDPQLGVFAYLHKPVGGAVFDRAIKAALAHAEMQHLLISAAK